MSAEAADSEILRTVRYLKDRQDILDCLQRESRGRDRHDSALVASCYWEDGCNDNGRSVTPARDYAEAQNAAHAAGFAATTHSITNHTCEIDGDVAYCETYCIGGLLAKDLATCKFVSSRFVDQFERRGGEWRIKLRRVVIEMVSEGDASWLQSPAISGFLRGQPVGQDPSYHRPVRIDPNDARW
jgi:hypothetical protein